nr:hypothetical protein [Tanacetum cinerariifolium]
MRLQQREQLKGENWMRMWKTSKDIFKLCLMKMMMSTLKQLHLPEREDLEALWSLVKERFSTIKPKNFSDDFLLTTLGAMKAKKDPAVKKYQAIKRKPRTKAQARKNMMMYLKNVAGFKMDYFKGMSYDDIR